MACIMKISVTIIWIIDNGKKNIKTTLTEQTIAYLVSLFNKNNSYLEAAVSRPLYAFLAPSEERDVLSSDKDIIK